MKLNIDCMRDILLYLEENLTGIQSEAQVVFNRIHILQISEKLNDKYDNLDIWYAVMMLDECQFIHSTIKQDKYGYLAFVDVKSLTYLGHQFVSAVRSDDIWQESKRVIAQIGNHSLQFIEDVARMIAMDRLQNSIV